MTRPVTMDIIARDKATTTLNKVSRETTGLAKQTNTATTGINKSYEGTAKSMSKVEKAHAGLRKAARATGIGVGVAAVAAVAAARSFVDAALDQQKANAQTAAVIKSTGGAAHVTAKQVGDLSGAISQQTGIMDDTIQASANMLLTFKNIRNEAGKDNDIFNQATRTVTDMSVALGQDGTKSAIQLGKALNDPIHGITALQRVGVTFTDAQKKQIKTLVEHGKTLEAQKIILKELNSEFGGSAAAQATAGGKMAAAWDNVKESVGNVLLPVLNQLAKWFTTAAKWMGEHQKLVQVLVIALGVTFVAAAAAAVASWVALNLAFIATPIGAIITGLVLLVAAVVYAYTHFKTFRDIVNAVFRDVAAVAVWWWRNILKPQFEAVRAAVIFTIAVWRVQFAAGAAIFRGLAAAWNAVGRALITAWHALVAAWQATYNAIASAGGAIINWFRLLPGRVVGALGNARSWLVNIGKDAIAGLWAGINAAKDWLWNQVKNLIPSWIKGALGIHSPPDWAVDIGKFIAQGLAHGISHFPGLLGNLGKLAKAALTKASVTAGRAVFGQGTNFQGGFQNIVGYITQALSATGTPSNWLSPILRRIQFESGGNPNAVNNWDVNAQRGTPSEGLMQVIGPTFAAYHQAGTSSNLLDPVANIAAAINYIKSRYGSIFAIDPPVQGYAAGSWDIARDQLAYLHRGEMVVPEPAASQVRASAGGGGLSARAIATAVADALSGATFRFDGDGLATLVTKRQAAAAVRGGRR